MVLVRLRDVLFGLKIFTFIVMSNKLEKFHKKIRAHTYRLEMYLNIEDFLNKKNWKITLKPKWSPKSV